MESQRRQLCFLLLALMLILSCYCATVEGSRLLKEKDQHSSISWLFAIAKSGPSPRGAGH